MSDALAIDQQVTGTAHKLMPRIWILVWLGLGTLVPGIIIPKTTHIPILNLTGGSIALGFTVISCTLFAVALLLVGLNRRYLGSVRHFHDSLDMFVQNDAAPTMCTTDDGTIIYTNYAAQKRFGEVTQSSMVLVLGKYAANPVNVIFRLQRKARLARYAQEDIVTPRGHLRLSVHFLNQKNFIWRLEDLVEHSNDKNATGPVGFAMLLINQDGRIQFSNAAMFTLTGLRAQHLDRLFLDLPLRSNGLHKIKTADGSILARVMVSDRENGRREVLIIPCDAEEVAGAATGRLFDDLPIAMLKLSAQGTILMSNRLARRLLGHSMNAQIQFSDLVQGLGRSIKDWLQDATMGHGLNKSEVMQATHTEQEVFLQVGLSRIIENGEIFLVVVLIDATELKTLEAQFVQSQKMQAIGQLAGGVAHDFNNLLTAISGYCELLLLRHDESDPDYGDLVQIHQNANRAASLVGQLLAFSRKQNLQPEILDLRDTLSDLSHLLNRLLGEKVTLLVENADDLARVRVDKRQLEQVLINLVVNARDAMRAGGQVVIESKNLKIIEELHRDRAIVPVGDYLSITVSDTGAGIPSDKVNKIFEPFFTTKKQGEGTGLGLSTAYGIIKQTGGFIFVDSAVGHGSTFSILLPSLTAPVEILRVAAPVIQISTAKEEGVVLLVEDEAPVRAFAARALRMRGYTVIEASDAAEALELLSDESLKVDIFVTDVIMPGMDGPTWVREARKMRPDVKVVFVSGYAEESFAENQAQIPNSIFLPKPFSLNELTSRVHQQIQ